MQFTPDNKGQAKTVPYFEDARASGGWEGQGSEKSLDRLKAEVAEAVGKLGGFVHGYQSGVFHVGDVDRPGLQLFYTLGGAPARMDIAALPTRRPSNKDNSLKMALYIIRDSLKSLWLFQQLSPGYAPLMPFMIADKEGNTISQLWAGGEGIAALLPPGESTFEGEVIE